MIVRVALRTRFRMALKGCVTLLAFIVGLSLILATTDSVGGMPSQNAAGVSPALAAREPSLAYYISPTGNDLADGRSRLTPLRTFAKAFSLLKPGGELILLDGEYSNEVGTGTIHYDGLNSAQPPSGLSLGIPTLVRALNPGKVRINGGLFLGRKFRKDSFITIQDITFIGGGVLYNTSYVTVKNSGFNGTFGIGTNDHHEGNSNNLIEDVWIWASGVRIIAINYRSHYNVWRRVVVRGDGCGTSACQGSGNPNVGITVYDSNHVSMQNVIVVDRVLAPGDSGYADFAVAQHTPDPRYYFGMTEWLGTISINAPDNGYYMEPDESQVLDPTIRISNAIAWNTKGVGFNLDREGTNVLLENLTVAAGGDGIRVGPKLSNKGGVLRNSIVARSGRFGINSAFPFSHVAIYSAERPVNSSQKACSSDCIYKNPAADGLPPSLRYLPRIEPGSFLSGRGQNGADIGANIVTRYGREGSRYGDHGFNLLIRSELWPWPNENRIHREMCAVTQRGFCSSPSLTHYIWSQLGNNPNGPPFPSPAKAPGK